MSTHYSGTRTSGGKTVLTFNPDILKELEKHSKQVVEVEKRTVRDLGKRAPSWVAQEVSSRYNISKSELTKAGKGVKKPWGEGDERFKKAGVGMTSGETLGSFTITYKGRLLSPFHFKMTPKSRPVAPSKAKKKKAALVTTKNYRIRAAIKTGGKRELGHYERTRKRGGPYSSLTGALFMVNGASVPGYRYSHNPKDVNAWKTLSTPQMVSNEEVHDAYMKRITSETDKMIDRYYDMLVD